VPNITLPFLFWNLCCSLFVCSFGRKCSWCL